MHVIRSHVSEAANVIFGTCCDESLAGKIQISLIVGGIEIDEVAPTVKATNTEKFNSVCRDEFHIFTAHLTRKFAGDEENAASSKT